MATRNPGDVGAAAAALVLEALIEWLRRKRMLSAAEAQVLFRTAADEAGRLPPNHVDPGKVRELIEALAFRARRRARLGAAAEPAGAQPSAYVGRRSPAPGQPSRFRRRTEK